MIDAATRDFLSEKLGAVPLLRGMVEHGQAAPVELVTALEQAALHYPVFRGIDSPVPGWLDELSWWAERLQDPDAQAMAGIRRASVAMRLGELTTALDHLDRAAPWLEGAPAPMVGWARVTRARIYIRRREFDAAAKELAQLEPAEPLEGLGAVVDLARGELCVEQGDIASAEEHLLRAHDRMPDRLIEDRIQALQALGFVYVTLADPKRATRYLAESLPLLRAAGAWNEVVQMDLVVGNFRVVLRDRKGATTLLEEGLQLAREHAPELEPALIVAVARARSAARDHAGAIASAIEASKLFAARGQLLGYVGMVLYVAQLQLDANDTRESYRTLLTGISIAKHFNLPTAEAAFRSRVRHLKQVVMGPKAFDRMVGVLLAEAKAAQGRHEAGQ